MKRTFLLSLLMFYNGSIFCQPKPITELSDQANLEKEYLKKGEDHFFEKRFGTALQWLKKAIEINPDNATAHAYIGDILLTLGQYDDALKHFRVASELKSDPSLEYFRIGQIYYLQNNRLQAEASFKKALQSNPELVEAHFYIGLISYRDGRNRQETLSHLKLFREKRPDFIDGLKLDKAIAVLEDPNTDIEKSNDLLTIDPLQLFYRKEKKNDIQKQISDIDKPAITENKTEEKSDLTNTKIKLENNDTQKSTDALANETNTKTDTDTAIIENQSATTETSTPIKDDGFIGLPSDSLFTQASVLWSTSPDKAIKLIDKAMDTNPKDAKLHSLRCQIYFQSTPQKLKEALKDCSQATLLSPDFRNLQNQGRIEEAMKDQEAAYNSYKQALDRKMEIDLAYHTIEIGEQLQGKQAETRSILERLLSRRPDHKDGLLMLLKRQQQEDNKIGLQATTEKLQSLYPNDEKLLIEIATVLLSNPKTKEQAIQLLKRYYDLKPDDVKVALTLAGLYLQNKDEKQALQILGQLYETYPTNYDVVRTILILFVRQNQNLDSAETIVTKYLESNEPTQEERQNILQLLPESMQSKFQPKPLEKPQNTDQLQNPTQKKSEEKPNVQQNTPVQP